MRQSRGVVLPALLGSFLAVGPGARAEEGAPPPEGEVTFGAQDYVEQENPDSAKFEEFRDVPNGFVVESFVWSWKPKPRFYFDIAARDVTQLDQRIGAEVGRFDLWRGTIRYFENPRGWTDEARSLFAEHSGGTFTLPDSFQSAVLAGGPNVDADANNIWDPGSKGNVVQNGVAEGAGRVTVESQRRTMG